MLQSGSRAYLTLGVDIKRSGLKKYLPSIGNAEFWRHLFRNMAGSIDDMWAELQAEDAQSRSRQSKEKNGTLKKKKKVMTQATKAVAESTPPSASESDDKQEITLENVSQQLHFHIRSIMNGNVGQRKESLRVIARCAASRVRVNLTQGRRQAL